MSHCLGVIDRSVGEAVVILLTKERWGIHHYTGSCRVKFMGVMYMYIVMAYNCPISHYEFD